MKKAIICDLDGTLADCEHRRHFVEGKKKNFTAFHNALILDDLHEWCGLLLKWVPEEYKIIFVSSRPASHVKRTMRWIEKHMGWRPKKYLLLMRATDDFRPDEQVKLELYNNEIKSKYKVLFVLDDRAKVVKMWREQGLRVLHCDVGDF